MKFQLLVAAAGVASAIRVRQRGEDEGEQSGPPSPEEIFAHCDANGDDVLEMSEAITCATAFVTEQIKEHWPKDDEGKPEGVTLEQLKEFMEGKDGEGKGKGKKGKGKKGKGKGKKE